MDFSDLKKNGILMKNINFPNNWKWNENNWRRICKVNSCVWLTMMISVTNNYSYLSEIEIDPHEWNYFMFITSISKLAKDWHEQWTWEVVTTLGVRCLSTTLSLCEQHWLITCTLTHHVLWNLRLLNFTWYYPLYFTPLISSTSNDSVLPNSAQVLTNPKNDNLKLVSSLSLRFIFSNFSASGFILFLFEMLFANQMKKILV